MKNQPNEPTRIDMSIQLGWYVPHCHGSNSCESEGMTITKRSNHIPMLMKIEPWQWGGYAPTWVDYSILLGSFGWFFMWFLLFVKQLPVMAIAEIKEIVPPRFRHSHIDHGAEHGGIGNPTGAGGPHTTGGPL